MEGDVNGNRPYIANYAIGLIFVMGVHMVFNGIVCTVYPEIFINDYVDALGFEMFFFGVGGWELLISATLFLKSGIAHKFALLSLALIVILTVGNMLMRGTLGFDIWMQTALGAASLVILLLKDVRRFYNNWSLGDLPRIDLES